MPTSERSSASEFFFLDDDGKKKDAELHEPVLAEGDSAAAEAVSRAVMLRLGIKPKLIDALMAKKLFGKKKAFDPDEPRDEEGRWTDGGDSESGGDGVKRPKVSSDPDVAPDKVKQVEQAVADMPEADAKKIANVKIQVVKDSRKLQHKDAVGLYLHAMKGSPQITVATHVLYGPPTKPGHEPLLLASVDVEKTAMHELGHAVDAASGWAMNRKIDGLMIKAGKRLKKGSEQREAVYWLSSPKEMWAELYALAYSKTKQNTFFGRLSRQRAEQVFAEPLAKLKALN